MFLITWVSRPQTDSVDATSEGRQRRGPSLLLAACDAPGHGSRRRTLGDEVVSADRVRHHCDERVRTPLGRRIAQGPFTVGVGGRVRGSDRGGVAVKRAVRDVVAVSGPNSSIPSSNSGLKGWIARVLGAVFRRGNLPGA